MIIAAIYWLLFSVILSLMHLLIGALLWRSRGRSIPFHNLLSGGSLLFFTASLTAKSFGDFYRNVSTVDHPASALIALIGLIFILLPTTAIYGDIVNAMSTGSQTDLPPLLITRFSGVLSASAVVYGFTTFLLVLKLKGGNP